MTNSLPHRVEDADDLMSIFNEYSHDITEDYGQLAYIITHHIKLKTQFNIRHLPNCFISTVYRRLYPGRAGRVSGQPTQNHHR